MSQIFRRSDLPIKINRKTPPPDLYPFTEFFQGFEKVEAVRSVFGEETEEVLGNLKLSFISLKFMYMGIRDEDGNISIGTYHLAHSDLRILYLDIVHELFHIKQWHEDRISFGKEHQKFMGDFSLYYSSPIEVPAYKHTVREAERIGMPKDEIVEYLKLGPASPRVFGKFLKAMEFGPKSKSTPQTKFSVRINRKAPITLYPFTEYFQGFEKLPAVSALLGKKTDEILGELKVEFLHNSFMRIVPGDDGHLLVGVPYLQTSDLASIYLDVLLSLNILHPASKKSVQGDNSIEAYRAILQEARGMGVSDAEIVEHFSGQRFLMKPADYRKFLRKLGLVTARKKSNAPAKKRGIKLTDE
jgi:hypothetical protein